MTDFSTQRTLLGEGLGIVELSGEVDLYTAPRFKDDLVGIINEGARNVIVDLAKVSFIDSTALGVIISGVKRLHEVDGRLFIVAATRPVAKILAITGLDKVLSIYQTRDDALAAL
jgi:anti-sigma B factor antagonist